MAKVFVALFAILVASLAFGAASGHAETVVFTAELLPSNEVPPITNADQFAVGLAVITLDVTRGAGNAITNATARFDVGVARFPTTDNVTGLHIHREVAGVNGPIRIDTGIGGGDTPSLGGGDTVITRTVTVSPDAFDDVADLLEDPARFYVNVHTTLNTGGAVRGQLAASSGAFPSLALAVFPSATSVVPGDRIDLKLFLANTGPAVLADVFAGVGLPADQSAVLCGPGDTALFFVGLTGGISQECASRLGGPGSQVIFLVEDVTIPVFPLTIFTLFSGQVPAGAGAGLYLGFAGVAAPNTFPNGPIKVETATFTLGN
jgi:CHRD domain